MLDRIFDRIKGPATAILIVAAWTAHLYLPDIVLAIIIGGPMIFGAVVGVWALYDYLDKNLR